jgi:type IV secretory pathway VirB10-like protein
MKTITPLLACLALLVATAPAHAGSKFYKWTDEQGVTHYTAEPPPSSAKGTSEVKVRSRYMSEDEAAKATPAAAAGSAAAPGKDDKAAGKGKDKEKPKEKEKAKDAKEGSERYAERCKKLQSDLQTMQEHARIRVSDGSGGEARVLSEEEKNAKQDEVQRQIKAFCE